MKNYFYIHITVGLKLMCLAGVFMSDSNDEGAMSWFCVALYYLGAFLVVKPLRYSKYFEYVDNEGEWIKYHAGILGTMLGILVCFSLILHSDSAFDEIRIFLSDYVSPISSPQRQTQRLLVAVAGFFIGWKVFGNIAIVVSTTVLIIICNIDTIYYWLTGHYLFMLKYGIV